MDESKTLLQTSPDYPSGDLDHLCHSVSVSSVVQARTSGPAQGSSISPLLHLPENIAFALSVSSKIWPPPHTLRAARP